MGAEPLPATVPEAVDFLLARLPVATRTELLRLGTETDLDAEIGRRGVGMGIRSVLGLGGRNPALVAALPTWLRHAELASRFFLVECWRRLQAEGPDAEPGAAADGAGHRGSGSS